MGNMPLRRRYQITPRSPPAPRSSRPAHTPSSKRGRADRGDVGPRDRGRTELRKDSIQHLDLESGRRRDLDSDGSADVLLQKQAR